MCCKIISPPTELNDEYVFEYAKWIALIFPHHVDSNEQEEGRF